MHYWIKCFVGQDKNTGHVFVDWYPGLVRNHEVDEEIRHHHLDDKDAWKEVFFMGDGQEVRYLDYGRSWESHASLGLSEEVLKRIVAEGPELPQMTSTRQAADDLSPATSSDGDAPEPEPEDEDEAEPFDACRK